MAKEDYYDDDEPMFDELEDDQEIDGFQVAFSSNKKEKMKRHKPATRQQIEQLIEDRLLAKSLAAAWD